MEDNLILVLSTFGGVILGWILNSIKLTDKKDKWRCRKDMKKALKNEDINWFYSLFDMYIRKYGLVDMEKRLEEYILEENSL
ncbi:MAG TPA: hypothetical protein VKM55_02350 [Candidatus Lokiarchaeia archaeon]|nr:hypothetical protein [Candidatus Lokiarchaeia archaeon]